MNQHVTSAAVIAFAVTLKRRREATVLVRSGYYRT
jgi:hypothetical protein